MQLSKNFSLIELTKSQTAERKGIDNTPSAEHQENLKSLCTNVLQPVRDNFHRVVSVSSGFRSQALCEAIGSKKTSQHAKGQACDFEINGIPNIKVAYWLTNNVNFDQCILEFYKPDDGQAGWIHVSYNEKGSNRKQILTYDGKSYENGLPEMKWAGGKVVS